MPLPRCGNPGSATGLFVERLRALTYLEQTVPGRREAAAAEAPVQLGVRVLLQAIHGGDVVTQARVVHISDPVPMLKAHLKHSEPKFVP